MEVRVKSSKVKRKGVGGQAYEEPGGGGEEMSVDEEERQGLRKKSVSEKVGVGETKEVWALPEALGGRHLLDNEHAGTATQLL